MKKLPMSMLVVFFLHAPAYAEQEYGLTAWTTTRVSETWPSRHRPTLIKNLAVEFRLLATQARSGKYQSDDLLWDDVKIRTEAVLDTVPDLKTEWHNVLVDVRNHVLSLHTGGQIRTLADWARALDEVAEGLEKSK